MAGLAELPGMSLDVCKGGEMLRERENVWVCVCACVGLHMQVFMGKGPGCIMECPCQLGRRIEI